MSAAVFSNQAPAEPSDGTCQLRYQRCLCANGGWQHQWTFNRVRCHPHADQLVSPARASSRHSSELTQRNSLSPRSLSATTSLPLTLTIANNGGAPMNNIGFQIAGQSASSFSWSASTCGATLNNRKQLQGSSQFHSGSSGAAYSNAHRNFLHAGSRTRPGAAHWHRSVCLGNHDHPVSTRLHTACSGSSHRSSNCDSHEHRLHSRRRHYAVSVTSPFSLVQNTCTAALAAGRKLLNRGRLHTHGKRSCDRRAHRQLFRVRHCGDCFPYRNWWCSRLRTSAATSLSFR